MGYVGAYLFYELTLLKMLKLKEMIFVSYESFMLGLTIVYLLSLIHYIMENK